MHSRPNYSSGGYRGDSFSNGQNHRSDYKNNGYNNENINYNNHSSSRSNGHGNGYSNGNSRQNGFGNHQNGSFDINLSKPDWSNKNLKPFEKEFYHESSSILSRSQSEYNDFLRSNNVSISGSNRNLKPVLSFSDLEIPSGLLDKIKDAKYVKPTPIQSMCWPTLLSGRNMVGIAQTGSGKTLGFILPLLIHIRRNHRYIRSMSEKSGVPGPIGLILAPTRELAIQIQQVAEEFGRILDIRNVVIYGGAAKVPQINQIRRGADIYIATPGRLLDFLKEDIISLDRCTYLILDEADRMLDMGFEPQIRKIIEQIRADRQTAMFSATWPREVIKLAEDFICDYVHVTIGAQQLTANPNIKQYVEICESNNKENRLREILTDIMSTRDAKVIIFAETKKRVDSFSKYMRDLGYHCLTIHGDKKQSEREWVLNEFRRKSRSILCATDVAARGLNIEDIKYVINLDYPMQSEDYIHRIGRTARSTNTGTSFTFLTHDDAKHMPKLIEILKESNQYISDEIYNLARMSNSRNNHSSFRSRGFNNFKRNQDSFGDKNNNNNNNYKNHNSDYNANRKRDHSSFTNDNSDRDFNRSNDYNRIKKPRYDDINSSSTALKQKNCPPLMGENMSRTHHSSSSSSNYYSSSNNNYNPPSRNGIAYSSG